MLNSCATACQKNIAFVFIKQKALTEKVKTLVRNDLTNKGMCIVKESQIDGTKIDRNMLIDKHYFAVASKSTKHKFKKHFAIDWEEALKSGKVINAMDACEKLGVDSEKLRSMWNDGKAENRMVELGEGFYCGLLEGYYIFNGFFMSNRSEFVAPGSVIYYYVVEWDPLVLSWADFSGSVIGPTDPSKAPPDSIRGTIFALWKDLGLTSEPSIADNCVHASASPFEGLVERMNWLDACPTMDHYGGCLMRAGVTLKQIINWSLDPQMASDADGKGSSLFDILEGLDADRCTITCQKLAGGYKPRAVNDKAFNIKISEGVSGNREFLSTTPKGHKVDLYHKDDSTGRQQWTITKGSGDWYNIEVSGGVSGNRGYLSTTSDGSNVDLQSSDDGSGRQRWTIVKGIGTWYNIEVSGGVSGNCVYLSTTSDGRKVDLYSCDDGSGRQRWHIPGFRFSEDKVEKERREAEDEDDKDEEGNEEARCRSLARFADTEEEDGQLRGPLAGLFPFALKVPTLEEALAPIAGILPVFAWGSAYVKHASRKAKKVQKLYSFMNLDEIISIVLYTMEADPHEDSLYLRMNKALRSKDRSAVKPWRDFIWLFMNSLKKLPASSDLSVVRGAKVPPAALNLDLSRGDDFTWAGFASVTTTVDVMKTFLGSEGDRTLINIQMIEKVARDIRDFSFYPSENELLLPPNMSFKFESKFDASSDGLVIIQVKQIETSDPILDLNEEYDGEVAGSGSKAAKMLASAKQTDAPEVRQFLEEAGLSCFADKFIDDGYDTLKVLVQVSEDELKAFGLKGGHRKKFFDKVAETS